MEIHSLLVTLTNVEHHPWGRNENSYRPLLPRYVATQQQWLTWELVSLSGSTSELLNQILQFYKFPREFLFIGLDQWFLILTAG